MFNIISKFFSWLISPILNALNFPVVPVELVQIVNTFFDYLSQAMAVFGFFVDLDAIKPALVVFLAIYVTYHGYLILMWVLKKIPVLGIE